MPAPELSNRQIDLFRSAETKKVKAKRVGLRMRILDFFKEKKYQSFSAAEITAYFSNEKHEAVKRALDQLKRSAAVITTGAYRGDIVLENQCLTLNLHKR